jgi:hypothetical protein
MPGTVTKFVIADAPPQQKDQLELLEMEQSQFGDLVFIHGILDTYSNLHLKVNLSFIMPLFLMIIWASCQKSERPYDQKKLNPDNEM